MTSSCKIWRPYTQEQTTPASREITRGEGSFLYTRSGQKIFDGISSWWLITHGHCHPEIVSAVQKQAARLDQVTFANFTHEPAEELAELLTSMMPPELARVFFSDNGSTAVEVALKMALQACAQRGRPRKQRFLAFEGAYHGDTVGAMSVSGASVFNKPYRRTLFDVVHARHPSSSRESCESFVSDFRRLIEAEHKGLAGVIIEPLVQGAGGMVMWPDEALRQIALLCRRFEVLLIFDEVMTGFGRTGSLFAMDRLRVTPDLLCLSKGLTGGTLPLALTLAKDEIYEAFLSKDKSRMFFHGHSFTGNPISCAAAVASLKLFRRPETVARIETVASVQAEQLARLAREFEISDPRVCGTIAAFEAGRNNKGYLGDSLRVMNLALQQNLFLRPLGNTIYLMPPYCADRAELESAWESLRAVVRALLDIT
jgi:adenosylmethionine-8-amino-7-oxononanoate aminotransferase